MSEQSKNIQQDLSLSKHQEEAICALHNSSGYNEAIYDVLSLLEKKLGTVNELTIEIRKTFLQGKAMEKSKNADELTEESNLRELLWKRFEAEDYK